MWEREPDDDFDEMEDDDLGDDRGPSSPAVSIEVTGLSLYTHHGVSQAEREVGQRLVFDIAFELDECDATVTDRIEDTVNYADVCEQVALGAQERSYKTLERPLRGGGRPPHRPLRCRVRAREGDEAGAADPASGRRGLGRGVEGSLSLGQVGYLGLGSNVGDRLGNLRAARAALVRHEVAVEASSSVYETAPQGEVLDQPDFLNAALRVRTALGPEELLDAAKAVERDLGREPGDLRHGPRPIDVDVLLLGDLEYSSARLSLPHREVTSRRFVLEPLLELDPELTLPDGTRLASQLDGVRDQAVRRAGSL
jgi:2-amino-4-hydroxy-6-hydroxymethyldihydropteridine diphosphokinase